MIKIFSLSLPPPSCNQRPRFPRMPKTLDRGGTFALWERWYVRRTTFMGLMGGAGEERKTRRPHRLVVVVEGTAPNCSHQRERKKKWKLDEGRGMEERRSGNDGSLRFRTSGQGRPRAKHGPPMPCVNITNARAAVTLCPRGFGP